MFTEQSADVQEALVGSFVVFMMLSVGIDLSIERIKAVFQRPRILATALTVNYLLVPLLFTALFGVFDVDGMWAVGLMFVAVAPGGPVAGVLIQNAGGHLALGVSLIILMNVLNTVLTPMGFLALGASSSADLPVLGMVKTIVMFQLLPLAVAMSFRRVRPHAAERIQPLIERAAKLLLVVVAAAVLISEMPRLSKVPIGMIALCHVAVLTSMVLGWMVTPGDRSERIAVALATPYRSISVVLLLLASWIRDMDAMLAAMTYSAAMLWMCLAGSAWIRRRGRLTPRHSHH